MRLLLLKERFSAFQNKKILDVGCNYGEIVGGLAKNNHIVGVDTDSGALKIARRGNRAVKFVKASATDLPFSNQSFDIITCLSVLEHIKDDQRALREISRVLKDGGELILTIPNEKANLIPPWLESTIKLVNRVFKSTFPTSEEEYLHFGQEGIGHVRQGYSTKKIGRMLLKEKLIITSHETYWHFPTRLGYILLMPLVKMRLLKEDHVKLIFMPFYILDRIFRDKKGDILIIAQKIT